MSFCALFFLEVSVQALIRHYNHFKIIALAPVLEKTQIMVNGKYNYNTSGH